MTEDSEYTREWQVAALHRSIKEWNTWRQQHLHIKIDLHMADLDGANLRETYLREMYLRGAYLRGADLSQADLSWADLREAKLSKAMLSKAMLSKATLIGANLSWADLNGAVLSWANLRGARLSWADLSEANLRGADLSWADLSGAFLYRAFLYRADLSRADLSRANLRRTTLREVDLTGANLQGADLHSAELYRANLNETNLLMADLSDTDLFGADLSDTNLQEANLQEADLSQAQCISTNLKGANLANCRVYGVSAWDILLNNATVQTNLRITPDNNEPDITVDNLEVAQFIYLMLHNENIRQVIDTIAKKAVLLLGRFTPERKVVLEALRDELRRRDYLPIAFDFAKPSSRDLTETVRTLAHMARFIIADLTAAKSVGDELANVVPFLPSVAVQPLIQTDDTEYALFGHWQRYPWVLDTYCYQSLESLVANLKESVIDRAEQRANKITPQ